MPPTPVERKVEKGGIVGHTKRGHKRPWEAKTFRKQWESMVFHKPFFLKKVAILLQKYSPNDPGRP